MAAPAADRPRVRVAALMTIEGRVVTVRHRKGQAAYHLLPGGGVDWGETLSQALEREVREETGLSASIGRLLFVNDTIDPSGTRHVVNVTFEATITGGSVAEHPADDRVEAVDLIDPAALATLDLRPPMAEELLGVLAGEAPNAQYLGSLFTAGA